MAGLPNEVGVFMPSAYNIQHIAEDTARKAHAVDEQERKRRVGNFAFVIAIILVLLCLISLKFAG